MNIEGFTSCQNSTNQLSYHDYKNNGFCEGLFRSTDVIYPISDLSCKFTQKKIKNDKIKMIK